MLTLKEYLEQLLTAGAQHFVFSKARSKTALYPKAVIAPSGQGYQLSQYTQKQVFHSTLTCSGLSAKCLELLTQEYYQLNAWSEKEDFALGETKKGKILFKLKKKTAPVVTTLAHNKAKNYLLPQGEVIPPLIDMGIFTKDGKIVSSMYDKYRQINRFIEIIADTIKDKGYTKLHIIDFGCGKSYLTFIIYHYLTNLLGIDTTITGLDLKAEVITKCNLAAQKYGYNKLHFELGDINGYTTTEPVDMVITLHACDTATDYALYNAISWQAKMIFSVPCCQHEVNAQLAPERLSLLSRYGLVQERFSALLTDALRANLLEYAGYKTQLLEFIEMEHTPKNILIRAIRKEHSLPEHEAKMLAEAQVALKEFHLNPTLYRLLKKD